MLNRGQAARDLAQVQLEISQIKGLGGAVLRQRVQLASSSDLSALEEQDAHSIREARYDAWAELRSRLDAGSGAGLLDLLARVAAVDGPFTGKRRSARGPHR